jgi:hypothetical protein
MRQKTFKFISGIFVITFMWQKMGYTDIAVSNYLRQKPISERKMIEGWMVVPDKEAIPAILKITRRGDLFDGEVGFELYLKNRDRWAPSYETNKRTIIDAAKGIKRGKVVVVGATPGLHDIPLDLLSEFNEIVIVDYDIASLRYDRACLDHDDRFKNKKITYCLADITGKARAFVEEIDKAYTMASVEEARSYAYDEVYKNILEIEPKLEIGKGADFVISSNVLSQLPIPFFEYHRLIEERYLGSRSLVLLDQAMGKIVFHRHYRQKVERNMYTQHLKFLTSLLNPTGCMYISTQELSDNYSLTAALCDSGLSGNILDDLNTWFWDFEEGRKVKPEITAKLLFKSPTSKRRYGYDFVSNSRGEVVRVIKTLLSEGEGFIKSQI